jgi:hypothetical protein
VTPTVSTLITPTIIIIATTATTHPHYLPLSSPFDDKFVLRVRLLLLYRPKIAPFVKKDSLVYPVESKVPLGIPINPHIIAYCALLCLWLCSAKVCFTFMGRVLFHGGTVFHLLSIISLSLSKA